MTTTLLETDVILWGEFWDTLIDRLESLDRLPGQILDVIEQYRTEDEEGLIKVLNEMGGAEYPRPLQWFMNGAVAALIIDSKLAGYPPQIKRVFEFMRAYGNLGG